MDAPIASAPQLLIAYVQCANGHRLSGLFILFRPAVAKRALFDELFGEAAQPFALGLVGPTGYLEVLPGAGEEDPWPSFYSDDNPHAAKLLRDHPYECYFIRHPSIVYANQALMEVNGATPLVTRDWKPSTKTLSLCTRPLGDGGQVEELVLTLDEQAESYYPKGNERYGTWTLYRDMPHADCAPVRKEVEKLQYDLGALRYVVGADQPYVPEIEQKKNNRVLNPETINVGSFDARTLNAVYVFQKDASGGAAFRLDNRDRTIALAGRNEGPDCSLAYLEGSRVLVAAEDVAADGVVDSATGNAIAKRHKEGLRSPHNILVCLPGLEQSKNWNVWLRKEAAERLYAWRQLTKALGFPQGIATIHTYRGALVDVGHADFGRSKVSIHKTGLAIDLAIDKSYTKPLSCWPIYFCHDQEDKKRNGYRVRWRLFGISDLPMHLDKGLQKCKANLQELTSDNHPLAGTLKAAATALLAEIGDGSSFIRRYFRNEIQQWQYDAWDPDGGKLGPVISPSGQRGCEVEKLDREIQELKKSRAALHDELNALEDAPRDLQNKQWRNQRARKITKDGQLTRQIQAKEAERDALAKEVSLFLDLTALGHAVGLERIGSFTNKDQPKGTDWGLAGKAIATGTFKTLADSIAGLKPEHGHLAIDILGNPVTIADIDTEFMTQWAAALPGLKLCRAGGPQVSCTLSRHKDGDERVAQLCSAIEKFPGQIFRRLQTGEQKTGKEWSTEIQAEAAEMKSAAPPNLTDSSKASRKKQKSLWTFTLAPTFGVAAGTAGEERIEFPLQKTIYVPAPGAPIGMEWWHFQVQECLKEASFGSLLEALGWTEETAAEGAVPALYYRRGAGYPRGDLKQAVGKNEDQVSSTNNARTVAGAVASRLSPPHN